MSQNENVSQAIEAIQKNFGALFQQEGFNLVEANIGSIEFANDKYILAFKYTNRYSHQFEGLMLHFKADPKTPVNVLDILEWQTGHSGYAFLETLSKEKDLYGLEAHRVILTEELKGLWKLDPSSVSKEVSGFLSAKYPW